MGAGNVPSPKQDADEAFARRDDVQCPVTVHIADGDSVADCFVLDRALEGAVAVSKENGDT
jgi:hypothetical protein